MASSKSGEVVDLLILVDATRSMKGYLASLKLSLPEIISTLTLTYCFQRIGLLAYRDYSDENLLEWSGWMTVDAPITKEQPDLVGLLPNLKWTGGGDITEATKTGLARAYELMRSEAMTLILLYTDAPPHMIGTNTGYCNPRLEQEALLVPGAYGGHGHLFADWVSAARTLRYGDKRAQVITMIPDVRASSDCGIYDYLSTVTDGICVHLKQSTPRAISEVTFALLWFWMGVKKGGAEDVILPGDIWYYANKENVHSLESESDPRARLYFDSEAPKYAKTIFSKTPLCMASLDTHLATKSMPLQNFAEAYKSDARYRLLVISQLRQIIQRDVTAMSLNPISGSLWRTVCSDRDNADRQDLLNLFGRMVERIESPEEKSRLTAWLQDSYDMTAEVLETIDRVPETLRFPCVCLDPTLTFVLNNEQIEDDDEKDKPITSLRRDELLEIGRSCDRRTLRRLGRVLTRITFIESAALMPAHISAMTDAEVPKIPMALASQEYGRKFWKVLLHIVVPGTMLSGRLSALLAALSIRLGIEPLINVAETEMLNWRDKWNNIEIPEIWSADCLSLLLDANSASRARKIGFESLSLSEGSDTDLLIPQDRVLFERLVEYKMLELNLHTTLHARIAWTPENALMPIGSVVVCTSCHYPRSVTVMGPDHVCGMCCFYNEAHVPENQRKNLTMNVSKDDDVSTQTYWCECSVQSCRAQYVVYDVQHSNIRPKCHYCRLRRQAPVLECIKCLSRVIWPPEYRSGQESADFTCMGCQSGHPTEVEVEVTPNTLRKENGLEWLLGNKCKLEEPFSQRGLYHVASNCTPLESFVHQVQILPSRGSNSLQLRLHGKTIHNTQALVSELYSWVSGRRTESGTCALCLSNFRKPDLAPACGRSGCQQRACKTCLKGWYGLNRAGHIINTAALHCPFCRRAPAPKTLYRNGMGVHAVFNLQNAVRQAGEWIYAWCRNCGSAKQYEERACAAGAPPEVHNFLCEDCRAPNERTRIRPCPGCGVWTEKTAGCNHIKCVCGMHWCFQCGTAGEEGGGARDIYVHMRREHGGYYGGVNIYEWLD